MPYCTSKDHNSNTNSKIKCSSWGPKTNDSLGSRCFRGLGPVQMTGCETADHIGKDPGASQSPLLCKGKEGARRRRAYTRKSSTIKPSSSMVSKPHRNCRLKEAIRGNKKSCLKQLRYHTDLNPWTDKQRVVQLNECLS